MPSSIPYDHPSLTLGNIVDTSILQLLQEINSLQNGIDSAYDKMNALIMMKRKLSMTINELTNLNVDVSGIKNKIKTLDTSISKAATQYMDTCLKNETSILTKRGKITEIEIGESLESPIDFSSSTITTRTISSESIKLDAQYFSYASNKEDDVMANIEQYIRDTTQNLGSKSGNIAKEVSSQITRQKQNHSLAGTLIITASCTHKNTVHIDPLVLDPDKAVSSWNALHSKTDFIDINDSSGLVKIAEQTSTTQRDKSMDLLTGVNYGSSFVGMVHILKTEASQSGLSDKEVHQLEEKMRLGGWLENASGGFGVDASITDEVRNFLSTNNYSSHVSMVVMGAIPSIAASNTNVSVQKLLKPSKEQLSSYLNLIPSAEDSNDNTVASNASEAKTGNQMMAIQSSMIDSVVQNLGKIDYDSNKVLDINSMMAAFNNYLEAIQAESNKCGVPINFYLKKITKQQIAELWLKKNAISSPEEESKTPKNEEE